VVLGNKIGTDFNGTVALPNGGDGVGIGFFATANTIGGTATGSANVLSGNTRDGLYLFSITSGNVVLGNRIGTDVNGTAPLPNRSNGVEMSGATANTIGGRVAGSANVISGNTRDGVYLFGALSSGNLVLGNRIGTDVNGTAALGNGRDGVRIVRLATANTIGGTAAGSANVISRNGGNGVYLMGNGVSGNVVLGNRIGTDKSGAARLGNARDGVLIAAGATRNTIGGTVAGAGNIIAFNAEGVVLRGQTTVQDSILGNSIFGNTGPGIDLGSPPANHGQRAPQLSAVNTPLPSTTVKGILTSSPGTYRLEFFASPPQPAAQGKVFLGFLTLTVPAGGSAVFTATGLAVLPPGSVVTATATNLTGGSLQGDTSPFSQALAANRRSWFN
jgi:titin